MARNSSNPRVLTDLNAENEALKRRLAELEAAVQSGQKPISVSIEQKHGKPFLNFTGSFVPFSFSVEKCNRIMENVEAIKAFAESKGKRIG